MTLDAQWHNYAVSFSDGRAKTGITSKPFYRLQDYIQEAHRHHVKVNGFKITPPSKTKEIALTVERSVCERYAHYAVEGHREWFFDDGKWMSRKFKRLCSVWNVYDDVAWAIEYEWVQAHRHAFWTYQGPRIWARALELAAELGKCGERISAARATALACLAA